MNILRHPLGSQPGQSVRDAAAELRRFAEIVPAMIVSFDEKLICRFANAHYADFFGFTKEGILGLHARQILGDDTFSVVECHVAQALQGHPATYQRLGKLADGGTRHLEVKLWPNAGPNGECLGFFGVSTDVTEFRNAERALRDSVAQLRIFADNVPAMAISYDNNLRCRFVNKRFAEYFGFTTETIIGKHLSDVVGEVAYWEIKSYFDRVLEGYPTSYQRIRKLENGEQRHLEVKLIPHFDEDAQVVGFFAVTADITEHKREEERIRRLAHHDSLTDLPNRLLYTDRLTQAVNVAERKTQQLALLYLDLDRFKPINDTWGHDFGDDLLKAVAERIRHQVRVSDTVARIGGDEFAVILTDISSTGDAVRIAEKIIDSLTQSFQIGEECRIVKIGMSIGIAMYPAHGRDAEALTKNADAAMYLAKQSGNCYRLATKA